MGQKHNREIAEKLLAGMGQGEAPDSIAALFSDDVEFEIPGDNGALPWIGRKGDALRLWTSFAHCAV